MSQRLAHAYATDRPTQRRDGEFHACFIDLTQAFDRVSWDLLWQALRVSGAPEKLIQVIRALYNQSQIQLHTGPTETPQDPFHPTAGVRQGCVLSPPLFVLMFDFIIRSAMRGTNRLPECANWPVLGGALLALLGYADGIVLLARNMPTLRKRMQLVEEACTRAGMLVSTKTKLLHVNAPPVGHPALALRHFTIEEVTSFAYLGSEVNPGLDLEATVKDRLAKADSAFAQLRHIWDAHTPNSEPRVPRRPSPSPRNSLAHQGP